MENSTSSLEFAIEYLIFHLYFYRVSIVSHDEPRCGIFLYLIIFVRN